MTWCNAVTALLAATLILQAQTLHVATRAEKPVSAPIVPDRFYIHKMEEDIVDELTDEDLREKLDAETGAQLGYNRTEWQHIVDTFEPSIFKPDSLVIGERVSEKRRREKKNRRKNKGDLNVCVDGSLAPELFVIGAQKASTTTLAALFRQSPNVLPSEKELHFFDSNLTFTKGGGMQGYLSHFPDCRQDVRAVAMDATPLYLFKSKFSPRAIKEAYGDKASRLKFLVILREPVERMQSAYYHGRRDGWAAWYRRVTFQQLANHVLSEAYEGKDWARPFEESKYVPQLSAWFEHFDPSQFVIAPMLYNVKPKAEGVEQFLHEYMWNELSVHPPEHQQVDRILDAKVNAGDHPNLEDDLKPETLTELQKLMAGYASPWQLAKLFYGSGAKLFGCDMCNQDQVAAWLRDSWSINAFLKHHSDLNQ